jgi:hypothetical protein
VTGPTVTYRTSLRRKPESRLTAPPVPPCAPVAPMGAPAKPARAAVTAATPIARMLALAHHVERLVEDGKLKDYADAARRLGMCKSHVTHIMALLQLAPGLQESIVTGRLMTIEQALRPICRERDWKVQEQLTSKMWRDAPSSRGARPRAA